MKKYCCYCFRIKKNTTFNSVAEYFSASTIVSDESGTLSDTSVTNVNRNSLLSALYTSENPVHEGNEHYPITSKSNTNTNSNTNSFLPPRRNSSDELDTNHDDTSTSSTDSSDNNGTWRIIQ